MFQEHFNHALSYLLKIKEICDRRNIALVIALIPDEIQVIQQLRDKVVNNYSLPEEFDFRQPNRLLSQELAKHNIYYLVDLVE